RYVLLDARARDSERKVRVAEFLQGDEEPDAWEYIHLLCRSGQTLLAPFGYTEENLVRTCEDLSDVSIAGMPEQVVTIKEDYKSIGESRSRASGGVGDKKPWRGGDEEEMPSENSGELWEAALDGIGPGSPAHSFDGKRFFDESLGGGDQLRHALLGVREDRVAPAIQAESFLEDGEGAVERQVAAGQRVHRRLEGRERFLKVRLFGHGSSCS